MRSDLFRILLPTLALSFGLTVTNGAEPNRGSISLVAGAMHRIEFPELGNMANEETAACSVSLPKGYNAEDNFPLLVWFSGARGSWKPDHAVGLVDFDEFIVVALPFPDGRLPRLGVRDGGIEDFEPFHSAMLERIRKEIPNISEDIRIVAGSSSGAHLIGSALDLDWKAFTDFFTVYVLHEGGYAPLQTYTGVPEGAKVLLAYGEDSKSLRWQKGFMERFTRAYPNAECRGVANEGHGLGKAGRALIYQWIDEDVMGRR